MIVRSLGIAALAAFATTPVMADYTLTVLHINDLHSRIEPISKYDGTCSAEDDAEGKCFGGVARVATMINQRRDALRAEGRNVIVLDAGDQFQGSLMYTTYKGDAELAFMNAIGFDAMAVGNHEFDDGPENLVRFVEGAEFPVISGNLGLAGSGLEDLVANHVVLEVGGEKIAILSALATDTAETSSPGPNVVFEDEITALSADVAAAEAEGINKIIALTHVGLPADERIAAAVDGLDLIVGGHSHTLLSNTAERAAAPYPVMVGNTPIVQAYAYSKYVGEITLTFDDAGNVTSATGDTILLDASVTPDPDIAAAVATLAGPIEELKSRVVAQTTAVIDGDRGNCRTRECEMGNLVADAMLDRTSAQGVTIAIQNGGGLRASIDAGEVTMGEVLTVLPFQNTLATFQLTGAGVVAALENGVSQIEEVKGRFPQVAGLKYTFDAAAPAGSRVSDVMVATGDGFAPIEMETVYGVVTNNYMRGGGDGYAVFRDSGMNAYDYGPGLEVVVADYLAATDGYTPYLDGRITAK